MIRPIGARLTYTLLTSLSLFAFGLLAQSAQAQVATSKSAHRVEQYSTLDFHLALSPASQTAAALRPNNAGDFSFTPTDRLASRSANGYYHLGDLDLVLRVGSTGPWQSYSTAYAREPIQALPVSGDELASANLAPTLPSSVPLNIVRTWRIDGIHLALHFTLTNRSSQPVTLGAVGIPMVFNNILTGRTLAEVAAKCSFDNPYIGGDAGYVQVTRLSGGGPALVIVPEGRTPLEAWKPIPDNPNPSAKPLLMHDQTPRGITFEGFHDWMVLSGAYQQNQWKEAHPWVKATTLTLAPGKSYSFGLIFLLAPTIPQIEQTLIDNFRPVAVGIPGYVLPEDIRAQLFLHTDQPVASMAVSPTNAITITPSGSTASGWLKYSLHGRLWGRARVIFTYQDGSKQTVSYFVTKPERQTVADLGHFLFNEQWFVNPKDPFDRSPSVISYDDQAHRQVTEEGRVWIAGLSDEAGAGSWLAAAMKELGQPDPQQIKQFEQFVDHVLWGRLQYSSGPRKYGVRKSLFYYDPGKFPAKYYSRAYDWKTWAAWNEKQAEAVDRSFDYPHVAAAYWVMYRLARDHQGFVTDHDWQWYLEQAYQTTIAMLRYSPGYARFGQMEGDVFVQILEDLKREGWTQQSETLRAAMLNRATLWSHEAFPFGSEMPWDSTGQEEVYAWTHYFGFDNQAKQTIQAILAFDPAIASWGYNGSATHYWDFLFAGKIERIERQLHHYGSGINAIPILADYRQNPKDLYLLRLGYGGTMGELADINQQGFASCGFHSDPDLLRFDPYSGDYGPGFFGFAMNTATYVIDSPTFGWLAFGGNLNQSAHTITVTPRDAFGSRVYLAPYGLWLRLDAGRFRTISFAPERQTVHITLDPATPYMHLALLRIAQPATVKGVGHFTLRNQDKRVRGAYAIPLGMQPTEIVLTAQPLEMHSQAANPSNLSQNTQGKQP